MNTPKRSYRVLSGPTAAGKTDWLLRRAQLTPIVVISADSRQVYRYMDIGTGKVTTEERKKLPHFGLDLLEPSEKLSVFSYLGLVSGWLAGLENFAGEVWFCGGTGLYLRAILEGLELGAPPQPALRPHLQRIIEIQGAATVARALGLELQDPNNPRRVIRGVEQLLSKAEGRVAVASLLAKNSIHMENIIYARSITDDEKSEIMDSKSIFENWECTGIAVLDPGQRELHQRIDRRVKDMFHGGLIEEARNLQQLGFAEADVVVNGIGYREALAVINGEMNLPTAIERTIVRTRQYAKRQRTYFRGMGWRPHTEAELPV